MAFPAQLKPLKKLINPVPLGMQIQIENVLFFLEFLITRRNY